METMEKPKVKLSEMSTDELVLLDRQLKQRREKRKKAFEAEDSADEVKIERVRGMLLQRFNEAGIMSARTEYGTAYKEKVFFGNIADRDIIKQLIHEKGEWELVTLIPNKAGIKAYIEHHGDVPPGINWREEYEIRVRTK